MVSIKIMEKKNARKQRKCHAVLEKETGIICVTFTTKNLAICNAGLSNGLSAETVIEHFKKFGNLADIVMLPGKSCCFISYKEIESAQSAYDHINGKLLIAQDDKPIYLGFTEHIPEIVNEFNGTPPGLIIIENFITEQDELILLSLNSFDTTNEMNALKHRQVKHYGYEFRYDINNVDKDCPLNEKIPVECNFLWDKLKTFNIDFKPDQLTVNYYKPGQGIPSHVDTHSAFEDPLISLSLSSSTVMHFKHKDGRNHQVVLPQRSICIMSKESRYDWAHGIAPRSLDVVRNDIGYDVIKRGIRVSFTFRKVLKGECKCIYTERCDSYAKLTKPKLDDDVAAKLESMHVHEVYENIANHFSDTRHKPWPNVLDFVKSLKVGSVMVDVGCGNGKYLGHTNNIFNIGCDRSFGLIDVCKERGFEVFTCNCLNIPLKDKIANGVISIAVIHHLANEDRRLQAIQEMIRVLEIDGTALIYVWAKDQMKDQEKSSYLKQDRKNRKQNSNIVTEEAIQNVEINEEISLPVHTNRKQFQHQDLLVPWKLKSENVVENNFLRYYHVFEEGELESLCKTFDNVNIVKSYYDQGNWCVIFKRIK